MRRVLPALVLAAALAAPRADAQLADQKVLTAAAVQTMLQAAEAEANANGWRVSIAIVDAHGELLAFRRLDGASLVSIEISQKKAVSAARFRRSTKLLADAVTEGRMNLAMTVDGVAVLQGGLPITAGDVVIGGIGVSGVTSQQDEQIAQKAVEALRP